MSYISRSFDLKQVTDEQIIKFISEVAPEQIQFITGHHFKHGPNFTFGAVDDKNNIIGVIRYCKQFIGDEQKCERISISGGELFEAKINAFAVSPEDRNHGIGKALQRMVISHAKIQGCYQVASYSTYDKAPNHAVKIALGFVVQPELQADGTKGCYFLVKL